MNLVNSVSDCFLAVSDCRIQLFVVIQGSKVVVI